MDNQFINKAYYKAYECNCSKCASYKIRDAWVYKRCKLCGFDVWYKLNKCSFYRRFYPTLICVQCRQQYNKHGITTKQIHYLF